MNWESGTISSPVRRRRRIPRSFKDFTPTQAFNPRTFFYEMVWKAWRTKRVGEYQKPAYPKLTGSEMALTWIGHASFLIQFKGLNALIDPNFANWIFLLKRLKRSGLRMRDLPPIDLVLLTHAHYDHFHKRTLRRLPSTKIGIMPWGVGNLAELQWWESFSSGPLKVTLVPGQHWGARMVSDEHRGFGGFVLEYEGRRLYHAGDSGYFPGFKEIGRRMEPEIALLPIGAYRPDSFQEVHMDPASALKAFKDLRSRWLVPMHFGTFKLSFEDLDEPPRLLRELARENGVQNRIRFLEEGLPQVF
jgi:L-ascorbate metabolism protein UlaG (beta-lactamase superfamily)